VNAYNASTLQCASLPVGSTVILTLSCTGHIYGLNDFIFMLFFAGAFFWPPKD
jgi:hypothetical protein